MPKDMFDNELSLGDIVVYAVGQGRAAGGQRLGRVRNLEKPVFSSIGYFDKWEKQPDGKWGYSGKKYREDPARRIGSFDQVVKIEAPHATLKNKPELLEFVEGLRNA